MEKNEAIQELALFGIKNEIDKHSEGYLQQHQIDACPDKIVKRHQKHPVSFCMYSSYHAHELVKIAYSCTLCS
jgi:hypothetical protein